MKNIDSIIDKACVEYCEQVDSVYNEKDVFKAGASFILSKWQEAERWRKVEEELPEVKEFGVSDYVLTKCDHESYQVAQYCKNPYYPNGSWFNPDRELSITPVEWKPIS